jgi:ribosomal protein S18 acetylase RimI-like enzyme
MSSDIKGLTRIDKSNTKPAVEVLVKAFQNYPLLQYYFPSDVKREKISRYFISYAVFTGTNYGEVYATSPNMEGVAVWLTSDNYPMTFWRLIRSVPLSILFGFGKESGGRMRRTGEYIDAMHKRLVPYRHWFLQTIGIDPQFQGKGYASKLLKPMLARIDEEGLPCYLDTLDETNVRLYEHFGFKVIEKSNIPQTKLTNWAMSRENFSDPHTRVNLDKK